MSENHTSKDRLKDIVNSIEDGIKNLFESEKYMNYLRTMSRFHNYSVNNVLLIHMQKPDATRCAGFTKWQTEFNRHVKKGEKGITIIAPTPYKKKVEQEKLDPDTNLPMLDENGQIILEEKEIRIPMFKPVKTFDVSQTEGDPLPELAENLVGDVSNYEVFLEALCRSSPVPIRFEPMAANQDGYFSLTKQEIFIRDDMSEIQTVCAILHEMAHAKLHNYEKGSEEAKLHDVEELEAESIAFSVSAYYSIETGANSFGYLAGYAKDKELKDLRASLETISKTADEMINAIDRNYAEIIAEQKLTQELHEIETDEPMKDEPSPDLPDPTISVEAMNAYGYTDADMLPLSKERAMELFERDIPVYLLCEGNTEAMAFDKADIELHTGIFGITKDDWEEVKDTIPPMVIEEMLPPKTSMDNAEVRELPEFGQDTAKHKKYLKC